MTEPVKVPPVREPRPRSRRTELERFVDLTVLGSTYQELGTCWLFTGTTTPYGRIAKAHDSYTHRLGWKLLRGPIPEGRELHHRCDVYACWNPDHLQLVTHAENLAFKRKTHCKRGHPLSGENVRIDPGTGARVCRACLRENQRRLRATVGRTKASDPSSARQASKSGRPPGRPRSVFELLVDRTVLGRCHPELGTCWVFTGPADPYGRIGKGSERFVHRLGWIQLCGPIPDGMELHHRRTAARRTASVDTRCPVPTYGSTQGPVRGSAVSAARNTSERFANACLRASDQDDGRGATNCWCCELLIHPAARASERWNGMLGSPLSSPFCFIADKIDYVNQSPALAFLLAPAVERL